MYHFQEVLVSNPCYSVHWDGNVTTVWSSYFYSNGLYISAENGAMHDTWGQLKSCRRSLELRTCRPHTEKTQTSTVTYTRVYFCVLRVSAVALPGGGSRCPHRLPIFVSFGCQRFHSQEGLALPIDFSVGIQEEDSNAALHAVFPLLGIIPGTTIYITPP